MDKEVDRLCSLEGGTKVFEYVVLPADKFDGFGNPAVPLSITKAAQSSPYVVEADVVPVVKGSPDGFGMPSLHRMSARAIRVSDKKILGEAIGFYRSGGEPVGPWHTSQYTGCTHEPGKNLNRLVFKRATGS
jgi:hypothetical protein